VLGQDTQRVRVGNPRRGKGIGDPARDGPVPQHPGGRAHKHHIRPPQHRPPAPRWQPAIREQQDQNDQQDHRQVGCTPRKRPNLPDSRQRPRSGDQPPQCVLLSEQAGRQRQPHQAQQPADGITRNTYRDQPAHPHIHDDRDSADAITGDPARRHRALVEPQQHQRQDQHQQSQPGQRPGGHARPVPAGRDSHSPDSGGPQHAEPGCKPHRPAHASMPRQRTETQQANRTETPIWINPSEPHSTFATRQIGGYLRAWRGQHQSLSVICGSARRSARANLCFR
jgi:hypothetical protein